MGCCETRDEKKIIKKPFKPKLLRQNFRQIDMSQMNDQDKVIMKDTVTIRLYVEWCKSMKKWDELAVLIGDQTEIKDPNVYIGWASKPRSVGSLSVVYLCAESQKNPSSMAPYVESVLIELIKSMRAGSEDFQENSMMLIYFYLEAASENSIMKMVKFNIFGVIVRFLLANKREMRHLTSAVCAKIYKNRGFAQEEFLNVNGGLKLVQLLALSKDENEEVLENLFTNLIDLIQDEKGMAIVQNVSRINDILLLEIVSGIDKSKVSTKFVEKIENILILLSKKP